MVQVRRKKGRKGERERRRRKEEGKRRKRGRNGRKYGREAGGRKGREGVADLHNLLCSNGPNDRLHGTGITAALVGKPGHESLIQLLNLRENKRPIRSQITYEGPYALFITCRLP